jgi:hypothetical protein
MRKAVSISLGLILLLAGAAMLPAQNSPTEEAVKEAVKRQADTITLRNKLVEARNVEGRGDVVQAAKLYQEAEALVDQIGSGIDAEKAQTLAGLTATRLTLARQAQSRGDLYEADTQVNQVLKADPQNAPALAFQKGNEQMEEALKGKLPSTQVVEQVPIIANEKTEAGTLVQDGKLLYEMGKLEEADAKLSEALKLDPDNAGAYYYLNIIKQAKYGRTAMQHTVDTQTRITDVEKQWVLPTTHNLPAIANPYARNTLIYTGPGRQSIVDKLDRIRLDNVTYGDQSSGLPLSEVLRDLTEKVRLRDPDKKGINFLINPNTDNSGPAIASAANPGFPGAGGAQQPVFDQATGLPVASAAGAAGGGGEGTDIGTACSIRLSLTDVRLADVLDAIQMVADKPIKYSIEDFAIVFSAKGSDTPQLSMRTFRVDPNTFYSGLESVGSQNFGSVQSTGGSGGSSGGGSSGGSGQNNGAVVGVVNAFSGAGGLRSTGGSGGGGGSSGQGSANPLGTGGAAGGGGGSVSANGGLRYISTVNLASDVSAAARAFFTTLGVNLSEPPGKSVFFNDRLGLLFVKATQDDLDTIERAIQALNQVAPQVHIKARFIEVQQTDDKALGLDWYLGQFNVGNNVVGQGGSSASLNVPVSAANPSGVFPGNTFNGTTIAASTTDQQLFSSGLASVPTVATLTGILTNPNFQVALHALEQRTGFENLAEPEVTTTSGRQTQMRATQVINIVTGYNFQQGSGAVASPTGGSGTP